MPTVGQVGHRQELQRESQFDEAQRNLQHVHPRSRLRCLLKPRGKQGEECEGQCQGHGKAQHAQGGSQPVAAGSGLYEQQSDDGCCTGERHQDQGEGHEEDADESGGCRCLCVDGIRPPFRQSDFKPAKERQGKDHKQEEERDIEDGIGRHGIQGVAAKECRYQQSQSQIDDNDAGAVGQGVANAFPSVCLGTLQEEADGHGDDGPDAGHQHGQQTTHEAHQQDIEKGSLPHPLQREGSYGSRIYYGRIHSSSIFSGNLYECYGICSNLLRFLFLHKRVRLLTFFCGFNSLSL